MESIFESIKPFGRFQKINTAILSCVSMISSMHFFVQIFNMAEPKLHCRPVTSSSNLVNNSNSTMMKTCEMWKNYTSSSLNHSSYECEFRDEYYNLTTINSWGLVCDKQALVFQSQTIFFVGSICIFFNGYITDKFGRKRTCTVFLVLISLFNVLYQVVVVDTSTIFGYLSVDTKFILYCIYQFLTGLIVYSLYATAYVMAVEFTTDNHHTKVANLILLAFVFGEVLLLIVFYLTRNWILTNWFITACTLVSCLLFICFANESPRWLAEVGKTKQAFKILSKIAKTNKVKNFKVTYTIDSMIKLVEKEHKNKFEEEHKHHHHHSYNYDKKQIENELISEHVTTWSLFWPLRNFVKLAGLFIIWNAINLNYSGVALGIISALEVNPFVMFFLASVFEALGLLTCLANDRLGRRITIFLQLFLVSICSILISFLPDESSLVNSQILILIKVFLALIGRGLISGSYNTIYIFASELFEVRIRSTAILFLSSGGCLSTLLAPQINMLRVFVWRPLPYIIYGSTTFLASLIVFILPETYRDTHHHR